MQSRTLIISSGQTEEGKTTIAQGMVLSAIDKKFRVLVVDGEHTQEVLINNLYKKVIGNDSKLYDYVQFNKAMIKEPKEHIVEMLTKWHDDRLWILSKKLLSNEIKKNFRTLLDYVRIIVKSNKIDFILWDNMMSLVTTSAAEKNEAQSEFLKGVIDMNEECNCASVIVTHVKKGTYKRGDEVDIGDISGNSDIGNLADVVYIIRRNFEKKTPEEPDGFMDIKKSRGNSIHAKIPLKHDAETGALFELRNGEVRAKRYKWDGRGDQIKWEAMTEPAPF